MKNNSGNIARAGIIAALYIVLTVIGSALGISNGPIQLRISEMLCILAAFTPAAIPGLAIGCLISNILSGCLIWDIVFGSLATLIGAIGSWAFRKKLPLAFMPPIITNTVTVPLVLAYAYATEKALPLMFLSIFLSETVSVVLLGQVTIKAYKKIQD